MLIYLCVCLFFPGTEPWHFYFANGILNFNLVFALALFSLPLTALMETLLHRFNGEDSLCVYQHKKQKNKKHFSHFLEDGKVVSHLPQPNSMCYNNNWCGNDALSDHCLGALLFTFMSTVAKSYVADKTLLFIACTESSSVWVCMYVTSKACSKNKK